MNPKVLLCLFIVVLFTTGCISEFNTKLPWNNEEILVVEGEIIANSYVRFFISKSIPLDQPVVPQEPFEIDAKLTLISSKGYESFPAYYLGKGIFQLSVGKLEDDVEYGIKIEYNGNTYQSSLSKPIHTPEIDSISWIQPEKYGDVFFRISTHDNSTKEAGFYSWKYSEIWEISAYYYTTVFFDPVKFSYYTIDPAPYFYCWKYSESNKFLVGSTESLKENRIINKQLFQCKSNDDNRFFWLYHLTVNQRAISRSAYDFYLNKIKLNEKMGGLFTPQPSEMLGNIICTTDPSKKAMGYIDISKNTTQKSIWVYSSEITQMKNRSCETISHDSVTDGKPYSIQGPLLFYNDGFRPANAIDPDTNLPTEWSIAQCTSCIAAGGTKNKPYFWPNNHY